MPRFHIRHRTRYRYSEPARESASRLILYPISDAGQEVLKYQLSITGDPLLAAYTDHFGNKVQTFTLTEPHRELLIESEFTVITHERTLPEETLSTQNAWQELAQTVNKLEFLDFTSQEHFNALPELEQVINAERHKDGSPYRVAMDFCRYIYTHFNYIKGVTTVESTLDEIWKLKAGVCQDFAHILLAMLRTTGIPARYVSGYICPNKNGMRGIGATHAWVEAWLPGYGWLGIDPTNNCVANEQHVRLALGRNFNDCSPVKGVYKGSSDQQLEVMVSVGYEDGSVIEEQATDVPAPVYESTTAFVTRQDQQQSQQ